MASPFGKLIEWLLGDSDEDRVTAMNSLTLPALWYGVSKIAGHCGRLPLVIHRKMKDGGSKKAYNHWAYDKLKSKPNDYQTADIFREQLTLHAILWGNGRAAIVNPGAADAELIPMMPDRTRTFLVGGKKYHVTQPLEHDRLPELADFYDSTKKTIVFTDDEVLHIPGLVLDGVEGLGIVKAMSRAIGLGISQDKHAYGQSKKGFNAKLLLEAGPAELRDEKDARKFIELFNEMHSSEENAGRAGLLRNGMKAHVLNMSNADAQFLEQRRFSRQDACLMLGLEGLPGDGDSHSYNSKEMENLGYLDNALGRWISRWEFQIDAKIFTERERRQGYYSRFNVGAVLRTDAQTQARVFSILTASRILNPNECREMIDRNPYVGGDEYINPAITQGGDPGGPNNEPSDPTRQDTAASQQRLALETTLKSLMKTEANNAKNGSKKADFLGWMDKNYAKWEAKLGEKLKELGLDPDLATEHCAQSREMLLAVAGDSKPNELQDKVAACVATWEERAYDLMGEIEYA